MINQRIANGFGYLSLGVLLLLFLLDWAGVLPPNLKMPLFFLALALFLVRITLRLILERRRRLEDRKQEPGDPV